MPNHVTSREYDLEGQLLYATEMTISGAEYGVRINPESWTLVGFGLPLGKSAIDRRIHRVVGHWHGEDLSDDYIEAKRTRRAAPTSRPMHRGMAVTGGVALAIVAATVVRRLGWLGKGVGGDAAWIRPAGDRDVALLYHSLHRCRLVHVFGRRRRVGQRAAGTAPALAVAVPRHGSERHDLRQAPMPPRSRGLRLRLLGGTALIQYINYLLYNILLYPILSIPRRGPLTVLQFACLLACASSLTSLLLVGIATCRRGQRAQPSNGR